MQRTGSRRSWPSARAPRTYARGRGRSDLRLGGWHLTTEVLDERTRAIRALTGVATVSENELRAEVAGDVRAVRVRAGRTVEKYQTLIDLAAATQS